MENDTRGLSVPTVRMTSERIELYLDFLSQWMVQSSPRFDWLMPLYERLEQEQHILQQKQDTIERVQQRFKQLKDQKAASSF